MTKADELRAYGAEIAIILGSGLNSLVGDAVDDSVIPYNAFSEIPQPTVAGHAGRFILGKIDPPSSNSGAANNQRMIFAQGRVHLYEGYSAREVTSIVRVLAEAGIKQLILTNAAGALNPKFKPGEWMMVTDHINLTGTTPLIGSAEFVDLSDAYSPRLREKFRTVARKIDMILHEGVYTGVLGPQYETPAEVRRLQKLGGDAVGMSTVLEVIQGRALGLEVVAFSCLTNLAAGITKEKLTHEQVLEVSKKAAADFAKLLNAALA